MTCYSNEDTTVIKTTHQNVCANKNSIVLLVVLRKTPNDSQDLVSSHLSAHYKPVSKLIKKKKCIFVLVSKFLPPANEVWGKVIFLHLFVILFMGGCLLSRGWGASSGGVPGGDPPGRLLLRAVRILLECILVTRCG